VPSLRSPELPAQEAGGLSQRPEQVVVAAAAPRLGVGGEQLPLVVEHLLEVRHAPPGVDAVAVEAAAELVVDAAPGHLPTAEHHVSQRLASLWLR
jgi:hypothetical protein